MTGRSVRPLFVVVALVLVALPVLIVGGFSVHGLVDRSFHTAERARTARALGFEALRYQLDEETGVRGYAATHQALFLQPYRESQPKLATTLAQLRAAVVRLGLADGTAAVDAASAANREWLRRVAEPLRANPRNALTIQLHGKTLVERFRTQLGLIDAALADEERALDAQTQKAIDRIDVLVLAAIGLIGAIGLGFGIVQSRLSRRLEAQRRESAALRTAYETEKRIADTLQDAFLQKPLPALTGVTFSATYVPATEEAKVGGDWYEGVELPGDRVMFAIGDVAGHGLDAAVAMNKARQSLVAAALIDPDPAAMLGRVNAELLHQAGRMVTAVCGYADSRTFEFTYATAGHPPPVLIEPGRPPRMLECGGLPMGVMDVPGYRTFTVQSVPGAMLVLYTDGAVEHSRNVIEGETMLLDAVRRAASASNGEPATAIRDNIFTGRSVGDDVAILTISFVTRPAGAKDGVLGATVVASGSRGGSLPLGGSVVSLAERLMRRIAA
jgi:serine phosphatase RsbU (regulator of sigma subunit)